MGTGSSGDTGPFRTERLLLRPWTDADLDAFAALNADPEVMQHFPGVLARSESDEQAGRIRRHFDEHGFGLWAIELPGVSPFIGFVGLMTPRFEAHFTPSVEVGWRIARAWWSRGYATEGARASIAAGFERLGLDAIVSMTVPANVRSRRVMEKLGMTHDPADDFDHPLLDAASPLRRHVLYRLSRERWAGSFR
jgi:RimJ/RimL family protein N-acetyltransferase